MPSKCIPRCQRICKTTLTASERCKSVSVKSADPLQTWKRNRGRVCFWVHEESQYWLIMVQGRRINACTWHVAPLTRERCRCGLVGTLARTRRADGISCGLGFGVVHGVSVLRGCVPVLPRDPLTGGASLNQGPAKRTAILFSYFMDKNDETIWNEHPELQPLAGCQSISS